MAVNTQKRMKFAALAALCIMTPSYALAGFEWSAPEPKEEPIVVQEPVPAAVLPVVPAPIVTPAPLLQEPVAPIVSMPAAIDMAPKSSPQPTVSIKPKVPVAADLLPTQPRRIRPSQRPTLGDFMKSPDVMPPKISEPVAAAPIAPPSPIVDTPVDEVPVASKPKKLLINPFPVEMTKPMPVKAEPMSNAGAFKVVEGFGKDLSLVIAMSQIVPARYTYSFSGDVDKGARVSWSGGKPWPDVLSEMLEREGLRYNLAKRTVHIASANEPLEPNFPAAPQFSNDEVPSTVIPAMTATLSPPPQAVVMAPPVADVAPMRVEIQPKPITLQPVLPIEPLEEVAAPSPIISSSPSMVSRASDIMEPLKSDMSPDVNYGAERPRAPSRLSRAFPEDRRTRVSRSPLNVPDHVVDTPVIVHEGVVNTLPQAPLEPVFEAVPPVPEVQNQVIEDAKDASNFQQPAEELKPMAKAVEVPAMPPVDIVPAVSNDHSGNTVMMMPSDAPQAAIEVVAKEEPAPILKARSTPVVAPAPVLSPVPMMAPTAPSANVRPMMLGVGVKEMLGRTRTWRAVRGDSLKTILTDWAHDAGVEMHWSSEYDYPLDSSVKVTGTFEEAVQNILIGLQNARPRPAARLHPNEPDGPAVLVVETQQLIE